MEITMNTSRSMHRDGDGVSTPVSNGKGGQKASQFPIADDGAALGEDVFSSPLEEIRKLKERNKQLEQRIREQEDLIDRLHVKLEKKKNTTGKDRNFTLVQIVDYCKGCVEWDDVKSIVAMLNKLLRRVATDEDSDLVDSIEEEFINRKYGNTYINNQTNIPNVSNYNAYVDKQNNIAQMTPLETQGQKQLRDE